MKRLNDKGFDIFGKRGSLPQPKPPEDKLTGPCPRCQDSTIVSTGYHGPPGDERGHSPCSLCQKEAYSLFVSQADFIYGVSIAEALNLVAQAKGEPPLLL